MNFKITNLNHASLSLCFQDGTKIVFDPWFEGKCFSDGWALQFYNPNAFEEIKDANYLWISHLHGDHFHQNTLKKLLNLNENIGIICNLSKNFDVYKIFKNMGFKNLIPIRERKKLVLPNGLKITRYPTTGIDNMLLIDYENIRILNYNDCNIMKRTRKNIKKEIGRIDFLLNNFNHAGKILEFPIPSNEKIKNRLKKIFLDSINDFRPNYVIPFASFHRYVSPETFSQNQSLLSINEISKLDPSIVPLNIGESVLFNNNLESYKIQNNPNIEENLIEIKKRNQSYSFQDLSILSMNFINKVNSKFYFLPLFFSNIYIYISDLDIIFLLSFRKKRIYKIKEKTQFDISLHSSELYSWWSKQFGTDTLLVGGHFNIHKSNISSIKNLFLFSILIENKLDFKSLVGYLFSISGWRFLFNRREEIFSLLLSFNFKIGSRN